MKINKWVIIGIIFIGLIISYYLGNNLPLEYLKPNLTSQDLTKGEYLKFITAAISACITFLAVIVALFKPKPKMKVTYSSNKKTKPPKDDYDHNAQNQTNQQKLDAILDKIKVGGYETLSKAEKEFLANY